MYDLILSQIHFNSSRRTKSVFKYGFKSAPIVVFTEIIV